ncbi:MAG TPA: hypothetical protein VFH50_13295 [Acidimicrobiales bacterium]|nr:hypothetical protein [Acidimicrobiales bacterium]
MNWQPPGNSPEPVPAVPLGPSDILGAGAESQPRRRLARGAVMAVPVLLLGAGVAASLTLAGGSTASASSPDGAVRALLDAAQHGDLLGVLGTLEPSERDALESGISRTADQLERLQVLSQDTDLSNISGINLGFSDIKTSTTYLTPQRAAVTITSGTATSHVDPSRLPLGSFTRSVAGSALAHAKPISSSTGATTGDNAIVAVQENGGWYVSLGYTAAEDLARSAGQSAPPAGTSVPAVGSATPDDAIRALVHSATDLDLAGVVKLTPPEEMAALHDYAPLFLAKADKAVSDVRSKLSIAVTRLDLADVADGSGAELVTIKGVAFHATYEQYTVTYDGSCLTVSDAGNPSNDQHLCPTGSGLDSMLSSLPAPLQPLVNDLRGIHPQEGLVAVQENGQWYFDPVRTVFTDIDNFLGALSLKDMNDIQSLVQQSRSGSLSFGSGG